MQLMKLEPESTTLWNSFSSDATSTGMFGVNYAEGYPRHEAENAGYKLLNEDLVKYLGL